MTKSLKMIAVGTVVQLVQPGKDKTFDAKAVKPKVKEIAPGKPFTAKDQAEFDALKLSGAARALRPAEVEASATSDGTADADAKAAKAKADAAAKAAKAKADADAKATKAKADAAAKAAKAKADADAKADDADDSEALV